ncbi:MAG TPA: 5'-methylthioadenosine/S-adenosylhomocysteine nucleosidase [Ktedonobacteraceae bacterium]|nr:5'-methylthioadenosine/S-adenosylhomocysteine nucleosidase [Ktedonobacteraceae bacterium]
MQTYAHIGIVVPTVMEQFPLIEILEQKTGKVAEVQERDIWQFHHTQLAELHITIIHSGPGMVNAGAATEVLILYEQPQAILNYGIAGSHISEALPGDLIIATSVCAPFNGYLQNGGVLNSAFGIRWDDSFGMSSQRATWRYPFLACDTGLVSVAMQAATTLIEQHMPVIVAPPGTEIRPARVYNGVISSADTYCRDEATFAYIRDTFGSLGEDMESAAVGQISARHGLPFAIIRCLSNNDMLEVLTKERKLAIYPEMARRCAQVTALLLHLLSE